MTCGSGSGPLDREARTIREALRAIEAARLDARIALGLCEQAGGVEGYSEVDEAFRVLAEQLRRGLAAEALFWERGAELGGLSPAALRESDGRRGRHLQLLAVLEQRRQRLAELDPSRWTSLG